MYPQRATATSVHDRSAACLEHDRDCVLAADDSQSRCGFRSPASTGTHAARSARPAAPIHDRSSTVFQSPGGADTTVTRPTLRAARTARDGRRLLPFRPAHTPGFLDRYPVPPDGTLSSRGVAGAGDGEDAGERPW